MLASTSTTPGHALKGTDATRMMGAVLGSAIQKFSDETSGLGSRPAAWNRWLVWLKIWCAAWVCWGDACLADLRAACMRRHQELAMCIIASAGLLVFSNTMQNGAVVQHAAKVVLHVLTSCIAFALARELLGVRKGRPEWSPAQATGVAGMAALLFAVHPVSGIAVNYDGARELLLMQLSFLVALLVYARMRRLGETLLGWSAVILLVGLSLLAGSSLLIAPLLWLSFDLLIARDSWRDQRVWLRSASLAVIVSAFVLVQRFAPGVAHFGFALPDAPTFGYGLTQAKLHLFHYLPHFWWPFSIRLLPEIESAGLHDYRAWLGMAFILASLFLAVQLRRSAPALAFCILAYWILMIPESSALPSSQAAVDYRPYSASLFLFLFVAAAVVRHAPVRRATLALAGFALYIAMTSVAQNRYWRTDAALWSHSVLYGAQPAAHLNLALSIPQRRDPRVRQNLEEAVRRDPGLIAAHMNLCLLQVEQGEIPAGLERCKHVVQLQPNRPESHYWLAAAYRHANRPWDALQSSEHAALLEPTNVEYHYQAALDAQTVREWKRSFEHVHQVRARVVDYKELRLVRGLALQMLHKNEEAVMEYRHLLAHSPNHARANFNAGYALMTLGRCSEAQPYFEKALALRPGYPDAQQRIEQCH